MEYGRRGVELLADAVTDEGAYDAEARRFRVGLDRAADLVQRRAGPDLLDALPERFVGHIDEAAPLVVAVADAESPCTPWR